jgi:hypothetical protein
MLIAKAASRHRRMREIPVRKMLSEELQRSVSATLAMNPLGSKLNAALRRSKTYPGGIELQEMEAVEFRVKVAVTGKRRYLQGVKHDIKRCKCADSQYGDRKVEDESWRRTLRAACPTSHETVSGDGCDE